MFVNDDVLGQNGGYEDINIDINNVNSNSNTNYNTNQFDMNYSDGELNMMGSVDGPIVEPGRERVIQRNIIHEVKHVCPFLLDFLINAYKFMHFSKE